MRSDRRSPKLACSTRNFWATYGLGSIPRYDARGRSALRCVRQGVSPQPTSSTFRSERRRKYSATVTAMLTFRRTSVSLLMRCVPRYQRSKYARSKRLMSGSHADTSDEARQPWRARLDLLQRLFRQTVARKEHEERENQKRPTLQNRQKDADDADDGEENGKRQTDVDHLWGRKSARY